MVDAHSILDPTEKKRAARKAYYERHKDKEQAQHQAWMQAHADEQRQYRQAQYAANVDKRRAAAKAYRAEHPDEVRAYNAAYQAAHKAQASQKSKIYRAKHRARKRAHAQAYYVATADIRREKSRSWRKNNPEKKKAQDAKRRARKHGAPRRDLTAAQWRAIKEHYGQCCVYCGRTMQRLTQDHIIPLSQGGTHTVQNVVPACQSCNSRKQAGPVLRPVQPLLLI